MSGLFISICIPVFGATFIFGCYYIMQRLDEAEQRRHDNYWDKREEKRHKTRYTGYARIINPAPELPVPTTGHPECGGKFCELRGCAIIGSCQRID